MKRMRIKNLRIFNKVKNKISKLLMRKPTKDARDGHQQCD